MTRSMTRWMLAGFMALLALGAVGTPAQADPPENPFAGSWSGTFLDEPNDHFGSFDWTISQQGRITGRVYLVHGSPGNDGDSGTIVGHVGADGKIEMVGMAPNDAPAGGFDGVPYQGTAAIDGAGNLVASVSGPRGSLVVILERN